ncbi:MAG: 2'-5' RNA ligase family protein [Sumerlaeia bacterium]
MPFAVAALLDEPSATHVQGLWALLEEHLDLRGIARTPIPHFSWQVAEDYDRDRLKAVLERWQRKLPIFTARSSGLGFFAEPSPILFLPIVRDPRLTMIHRKLLPELDEAAISPSTHYEPENWVPHITLAAHDLTAEKAGQAMQILSERPLLADIRIEAIGLIGPLERGVNDLGLHMRYGLEVAG